MTRRGASSLLCGEGVAGGFEERLAKAQPEDEERRVDQPRSFSQLGRGGFAMRFRGAGDEPGGESEAQRGEQAGRGMFEEIIFH